MVDAEMAKTKALELLAKYRIETPPVDPEIIAEAEGVRVLYARFKHEASEKISGFIDLGDKEESPKIFINKAISTKQKMFTIAHELGHYMLHQKYALGENYRFLPRYGGAVDSDVREEREADVFAENLLVPERMLGTYMKNSSVSELSTIFIATEALIVKRMSCVG